MKRRNSGKSLDVYGFKQGTRTLLFSTTTSRFDKWAIKIDKIQVEGDEIKGREEIKEVAHNYFKNLLVAGEQKADNVDFLQQILSNKVSEQRNNEPEKEVTAEEIREAIWSMHPEKALGLDGFTIAFYKSHWETTKNDLVRMIKNVLKNIKWVETPKPLIWPSSPKRQILS